MNNVLELQPGMSPPNSTMPPGIEQINPRSFRWHVVNIEPHEDFHATGVAGSVEEAVRRQGLVINACKDLWK